MLNRYIYIVSCQLLIASGFCTVLFEMDFTEPMLFDDPAKAHLRDGSLDYRFRRETGDRLHIKDFDAGVRFRLAPSVTDPTEHHTVYYSVLLRSLNETTKEKFAGVVFYKNGREVFGLGNDWASDYFSVWKSDGRGIPIGDIPTRVDNDVHKIVMRIDYNPDGPETLKVGLNPFCRRSEDRQPPHIWTTLEYELSFDEIRIRSGKNDCLWEFDELRIGTSWESVTPPDNLPGEYVETLTANSSDPRQAEMIGDGIARFWAAGDDSTETLPSFVLETPRQAAGPVAASWRLTPQFGTYKNQTYAYVALPADIDLYGTGEVTGGLLRNGRKIVLFNKDNYGYGKPDQLYQSHPWVLGLRPDGSAFGMIFDTPWKAELDLRAGILFTVPKEAPPFPVIIIEGINPQEVMIQLAGLTGTMPMPPRWALGYQQCRYSYYPDARVRAIADTFRAKQIPCDVIWLDIHYMDGYRVFTFDPNHFPDPKDTNTYLHSLGFKSVWMIDPGVKHDPGYFVYDSGTRNDVWVKTASGTDYIGPVWPGDCVFPDFTVPAVRRWWGALYQDLMAKGIDGIWNDMNEPAVFKDESEWTMPLDNLHRGGGGLPPGPHIQYHNIYGMLMVKASREGILKANPEKRPFVLSRANFLGGHRYAATWTGDNNASWQHLKWSIPMSLNLSLSGQPFNGPDIGGFVGNASPDLWAHWIAVGAFYPFSRAHTSVDTDNQEPWEFGPEAENASRIALQRRYRLMPYLYTVFRESHKTGMPVMRPVFFADPADLSLRIEDRAFLIGRDLKVIPKWAEPVQTPKGIWRRISLVGEDSRTDPYQCDLRIRGGSVVPLGPVLQTTEQIVPGLPLTLVVVLDEQGRAEGKLYEDAGDGYHDRDGEFCLSTYNAQKNGHSVVIRCTQQEGQWKTQKRLVTVAVVEEDGVRYGFGDICTGVTIRLDDNTNKSETIAGLAALK